MSQAGEIDVVGNNPDIPVVFVTDNGAAVPIANILEILGDVVPAGAVPVETEGSGNTVTINVQVAQDIAASNINNVGLAAFDSSSFNVDANGFVTLVGTGVGETITGNVGGAISPSAGNWNLVTSNSTIKVEGASSTLTLNCNPASNNLCIGTSLPALSGGIGNVVFGNIGSGASITSGVTNVIVGAQCGTALTTASSNVLMGNSSGAALTTGSNCTAIGDSSLNKFTSGAVSAGSNVAIGSKSLFNLVSGTFNTCIGTNSGTSLTTNDSNNIIIGNSGTAGDISTIRIGTGQTKNFQSGINGITVTGSLVNVASTGQLGSIASGSVGQLLSSGGAGVSPLWTTATFPVGAAGTAGKVLISDGTNWVASTPTFPNASATGGKQIRSDGTNWVAGTIIWGNALTTNSILYASATNTQGQLATSNNGVLIASNTGVPSFLAAGTTGQVLTATTGVPPSWTTLTNFSNINVQTFTSSGTYTPTSGMKFCVVEVCGGGGGGGGAALTGVTQVAAAGGGGGGGYSRIVLTAATVGASQTVTIGAGGTAGANTGGNGGTGGLSLFGFTPSGNGGAGGFGAVAAVSSINNGNNGGNAGGGNININGICGGYGISATTIFGAAISGSGGGSAFSGSEVGNVTITGAAGFTSAFVGVGGTGAANYLNQGTGKSGGAGTAGIIIITEYI